MFTFVQSAAAKLATHTSRSVVTPVNSRIITERSYDPKFCGDLVERLCAAIELGNVRSVGRRVFGRAKKLLTKRTQSPSATVSDESFCSPGTFDDEEAEMPVIPIRRRPTHDRNRQNACTEAAFSVQGIYVTGIERSYGRPRYEVDRLVSMPSGNANHLDANDNHQYRGILEAGECKLEPGETEYSTILVVDKDGDVAWMGDGTTPGVFETGDGTVRSGTQARDDADTLTGFECTSIVNPGNTRTTPFAVSPFFCLPTTDLTTPPESESEPSTPQYMPVLVYESASYEDALFTEFKAIIDRKAANESVE